MRSNEPSWIEPEMRDEAIRLLREGDFALSREWVKIVASRYSAITLARLDQAHKAICDACNEHGAGKPGITTDESH